jgi:hypothetical protein
MRVDYCRCEVGSQVAELERGRKILKAEGDTGRVDSCRVDCDLCIYMYVCRATQVVRDYIGLSVQGSGRMSQVVMSQSTHESLRHQRRTEPKHVLRPVDRQRTAAISA